jgi:hypothetical protein
MHRVKRAGNYANIPAPPAGGTPGYFGPGDPGTNTPATIPGYDWFNAVQEEILGPIEAAGLTPDEDDRGQLLTALNAGWGMAKSISTSGYLTLPGGIIMQWGEATTNASGVASVTLPIAFPAGILTMLTNDGEGTAANVAYGGVAKNGLTGITLTYARGGAANNAAAVFWLALGY